jgi:hypothetical protein
MHDLTREYIVWGELGKAIVIDIDPAQKKI